ncbi:MAG TPA: caspase family protein [Steroidobacteraceae bacterium]|nr:caspase family protein [Steroidobacteraceae bacterium]
MPPRAAISPAARDKNSSYVNAQRVRRARRDSSLYTGAMGFIRFALLALTVFGSAAAISAENRIALVIGNSDYSSGPLPNPANDAKMIGATLSNLGFEVIARRNADQNTMKRAIQEFGSRLEKAGPSAVGLFYYAGHGVQLNGRNYLIPTTAQIEREGDVEIEAVSADWVIEQMRYARNRLNIVILDACRNNPFTRSMRSVDHGLASMDAPAGILIAYSTAPGAVAADGSGRDSPYTEALSQAMRELHEPVEQVFKHVRVGVMSATSGKQVPWESSSLTGDFYFAAPQAAPSAPAPPVVAAPNKASGSFTSWVSGWFGANKEATEPAAKPAAAPIRQAVNIPNKAPDASAGSLAGSSVSALLQTVGIEFSEIDAAHSYPPAPVRQLLARSPRHVTVGNMPKQIQSALSLCRQYSSSCQLSMFSDEVLRTQVLDPFELDALPVSVQAFRQFVDATHYKTEAENIGYAYAYVDGKLKSVTGGTWRNGIKQHEVVDEAAVVAVSFQDAVAYCKYKGQRLPSENEWEYVARGPERHTFPWGENMGPAVGTANAAPRVGDGPAEGIGGRYRGLSGNVWQWVDSKVNGRRVLKGASWLETNPAFRRPASRRYELPGRADEDSGFRCAKSVTEWPDTDFWLAQVK